MCNICCNACCELAVFIFCIYLAAFILLLLLLTNEMKISTQSKHARPMAYIACVFFTLLRMYFTVATLHFFLLHFLPYSLNVFFNLFSFFTLILFLFVSYFHFANFKRLTFVYSIFIHI